MGSSIICAENRRNIDSTEIFEVNTNDLLPIHLLNGVPNKNHIEAIDINDYDPEDTTAIYFPVNTISTKKQGIIIKTKKYDYNTYTNRGQGLNKYAFEDFKETTDSIFFYNLDDIYFADPSPHLDTLKLKKGNVVIRQDKNKQIISIDINDLILSGHNNEFISNLTYELTPKKPLKSDNFSNYGVFKEMIK